MKSLILIFVCLLLVTPCQAVEKQPAQTEQIEQRIKIQQERLKDIDELVIRERQDIENWYAHRLAGLRQLAEKQAAKLEPARRIFWTEFLRTYNLVPYADTYFSYAGPGFARGGDTKAFKLRDDMIKSYSLITTADFLMDNNFYKLLVHIANSEAQNLAIRKQAYKLLAKIKEFESRAKLLQNQKEARLAQLEKWEKDMRADVFRVMGEIKILPQTPSLGIVNVISYEEKNAVCMVDGVDKILRAGDVIGNITVVKIYKNRVEFAKDGQRWMQAVGQSANSAWR